MKKAKTLSVIPLLIISTLIQLTFVMIAFSVTFGPDGNRLATGSANGTVHLWNANTGKEIWAFTAHTDAVLSVAFSPDGNRLATGSADGTARLWNANTGKEIRAFTAHTDAVLSVAFRPDGNRLATGSADGTARLWNANTGKHIRVWDRVKLPAKLPGGYFVTAHGEKEDFISFLTAFSVVFSPDGNRLAIGTLYADAQLWNANTGELIYMLNTGTVQSLAFRPDGKGKQLATVFSSEVRLWNTDTGKRLWTFEGDTKIRSVAFSPDGKQLATVSIDGTVQLWNVNTGKRLWTFEGNTRIRSVAFSPDGNRLATGSMDGTAWLLNANTDAIEEINNISIPDKMLASVIRKKLGLKSQEPITQLDLRTLTRLNARDSNITNISGIEHAVSLSELQLDTNHISDISGLSRLTGLRVLKLDSNQISDMTPLAKLKNLQSLTVSYQRHYFSDITPLANLKVLFELHLYGNHIKDISALSGLTNLWSLLLDGNQISDITPLANLKALVHLGLNDNRISDITPLAKLTNVKYLYLQNNQIHDVSPLAELTNLEELKLYGNPIKDTEPLLALLRKNPDVNIYLKDDGEPLPPPHDVMELPEPPEVVIHVDPDQLPPMYWSSSFRTVSRLVGGKVERDYIFSGSMQNLTGFAVDSSNNKIYWQGASYLNAQESKIRRANLDGTNAKELATLQALAFSISVDPQRKKLYWISFRQNSFNLMQSNLNAKHIKKLGSVDVGDRYLQGIDVDIVGEKLYIMVSKLDGSFIVRTDLNFKNPQRIANNLRFATDLAISGNKIYWMESNAREDEPHSGIWTIFNHRIKSANLNGSNVKVLVRNFAEALTLDVFGPIPVDDSVPFTVDSAGKKLYWTANGEVWRANLNGKNRQKVASGIYVTGGLGQRFFTVGSSNAVPAAPTNIDTATPPEATALLPNYPNPFNPETWIPYQLAAPADVRISIYAADGTLVRRLALGHQSVGIYASRSRAAYWDGRNDLAEPVASGVYFYTLTAGDYTATRKLLIRK